MVLSVSSPQSKADEKGSTLRNSIGHYLDIIGSIIMDCSTRLATVSSAPECSSLSLDYFEYAAYVWKRRKGGNTNSPWSKTEFLPIFRHRRHTTQFRARGGRGTHNYL